MHIYTRKDGVEVPSVTTILQCLGSKEIIKWANYLGFKHIDYEKELERTAINGTKIHDCLQYAVDPKYKDSKIEFNNVVEANYYTRITNRFLKEMSKFHYSTICTETEYTSTELMYAGKIDWLFSINGLKILGDFKSSKKVHMKHLLQLGGYRNLLEKNDIYLDGAMIILVNEIKIYPYIINQETLTELGKAFDLISQIYQYLNKGLPPIDKDFESQLLK